MTTESTEAPQVETPKLAGDEAIMAEMEAMMQAEQDKAAEEPVEEPAEESDEVTQEAKAEEPAEESSPEEVAPEETKSLERIQRAEEKSLAKIAEERAAFEKEVEQMRPHLDEYKAWLQAKANAKIDPASVAMALGMDPETDAELWAKSIWALSPAAQKDPKARAAAQRALKDRKASSEVEELRAQVKRLEEQSTSWRQQQENERVAAEYMSKFDSAISPESVPLVAKLRERDTEKANAKLGELAMQWIERTGEVPSHSEITAALEKQLKNELDSLGVDVSSILGQTPAPQADATRAAKPVEKETSAKAEKETKPPEELTEAELDAQLLKELEAMVRQKNA